MKTVAELGEDALIARLLALWPKDQELVHVGPGDDCAVLPLNDQEWQLLKTDAIVEGIHFLPEEDRRRVGWKAMARVVSDFAAMGGEGRDYLVTLGVPYDEKVHHLEELYRGMADCLQVYGGTLVGGETTSVPCGSTSWISIAARGVVKKTSLVLRSTAQEGDRILVTGQLGGSIQGRHLDIQPRVREAQWLASYGGVTAMMDVSDGLAKDLPRLALASGCGYQIDVGKIPCSVDCSPEQALSDGEDYELLLTVSPERVQSLMDAWSLLFPQLSLSQIGEIAPIAQSMVFHGGWDHFQNVGDE